jgi:DNA transformation protein and related proteins
MPRPKAPRRMLDDEESPAPASDSMREWLEDAMRELPQFQIRRMFGGAGLYARGRMFGILYRARVYLKTDATTAPAFVERGMEAFRVRQGTVLTQYFEVPASVLADEAELLAWARTAHAVAEATPKPKRSRKTASRKRSR